MDLEILKDHGVEKLSCTALGEDGHSVFLHNASPKLQAASTTVADSKWVCENGGEKRVGQVMLHVFDKKCRLPDGGRGLMLDVGANMGYFGMLALAAGCEALLFDLQLGCQKFLNNALVINGFQSTGRVVPGGVGGAESFVNIADGTCDGRFPVSAREKNKFDPKEGTKTFIKPLSR